MNLALKETFKGMTMPLGERVREVIFVVNLTRF
jgi:hypothetical protein